MRLSLIGFYGLVTIILFSCKAPAPVDIAYFQDIDIKKKLELNKSFEQVFKIDDIISIVVSAADMDTARPFNLAVNNNVGEGQEASSSGSVSGSAPTYHVDYKGNIEFPVLGELKVSGLTRNQLKEQIKQELKSYINDPIVTVRLSNFKITILGEVSHPGSFTIPNERVTILEALGMAGDLTIKGKRTNLLIIREKNNVKTYHRIDLTSEKFFNSDVYYLNQNDVVYVEPNESRTRESINEINRTGLIFSSIGVAVSVITLLFTIRN